MMSGMAMNKTTEAAISWYLTDVFMGAYSLVLPFVTVPIILLCGAIFVSGYNEG